MENNFTEELDNIAQKQWKNIYNQLKGIGNIFGVKILVEPKEVIILLQKYQLDTRIEFITNVGGSGEGQMEYYFNGDLIKPDGLYSGVERNVSLLELLRECTIQQTYNPDIKHLQKIKTNRDHKLKDLLK